MADAEGGWAGRLASLYPAPVRKYVLLATLTAVLILLFDWVIFFTFCQPVVPFGFINLLFVAMLWSRWTNKVVQLNVYMVYVLITIAMTAVTLSRNLQGGYANCLPLPGAASLVAIQCTCCIAALGLAVYLRLHVLHTAAVAGAERIAHAAEHQPILHNHHAQHQTAAYAAVPPSGSKQ